MIIVHTLAVGPFQSNCIILGCPESHRAVVIDPGAEGDRIIEAVDSLGLEIEHILLTHAHLDHVGGVKALRQACEAPVALHPLDRPVYDRVSVQAKMFGLEMDQPGPPDENLDDGQLLGFGDGITLKVIHTPGHSPGGVCFYLEEEKLAAVGDTVFAGSIGRTDLWGGDYSTLIRCIKERLMVLDPETRLITGHGPDTTVMRERLGNPFLL